MDKIPLRILSRSARGRISTITRFRNTPRLLPVARPLPSYTTLQTTGSIRHYSSPAAAVQEPLEPPSDLNEQERAVFQELVVGLQPVELVVSDISGGCGSMYAIEIASERFRGLGMLAQQRLVNKLLKEKIGGWHGMQLKTKIP